MGGKKITARSLKGKSNAPTHPNSRRAAQLARISHRTSKLQQAKSVRSRAGQGQVDRVSTLILLLPPDLERVPDLAYLHAFLQDSFLTRHDDEIAQLDAERRKGRPMSKREEELREVRERERREYQTGMELPDLMNEHIVTRLRVWNGDRQALGQFRFVRLSGDDQ